MGKGQKDTGIRRTALILATQTVADCPLDATCICTVTECRAERKVICGHYQGLIKG